MSRIALGLSVLLLSAADASRAQAADAKEIVTKAVEAAGGAKTLKKYPSGKWTADGKVKVMGMEFDYTGTWHYHYPDKFRFDITVNVMGMEITVTQCLNGKNSWKKMGDEAATDLADAELERMQQELRVSTAAVLYPLLTDEGYSMSVVGEEKVGESKATGINVTHKNGLDANFYFDNKTHMLVKMSYQAKDETGKEVSESVVQSAFKKIKGVATAMKVRIYRDDKLFVTANLKHAEPLEKVDAAKFKKPK